MNSLMVAAVLLLVGAGNVLAQLPANVSLRTLETSNFRVTYEANLEGVARHAAASGERAHAALTKLVGRAPAGKIDMTVTDNVDYSNGHATPLPSNRIGIYAKPPVDALALQYTQDWIELVVVHELAHIFHVDLAGGFGRAVRGIFGQVSWPFWPVMNVLGTPLWSIEGFAVTIESSLTSFGRVNGSYHEMIVRTASLEAEIEDLDRLRSSSPVWPGVSRVYIYGSLFMDYLGRRYGPDATARILRSTAGAVIPPPFWFSGVSRSALGISFEDAYRDWTAELTARYAALAARIEAEGITPSERLTTHGRYALYPRFSPAGDAIAYASSDGRSDARSMVIDARSGGVRWSHRRNAVAPVAWHTDGSLLTSDLELADPFHVYSDLHVVRRGDNRRLTRDARLQEPDVTRDGRRIVAVENGGGTNRLVLVDPSSAARRALTGFDADVQWTLPRWSPDGSRIAVSRWRTGGSFDVVVLDTMGVIELEVANDVGVIAGVAWSPDARWLVFSSDRSGIPNLYAADIAGTGGALRQVTNVLTGAFYPDVSPDGSMIAFSRYHHDGFSVERMPFDPQSWREPQTATLSKLAEQRGSYDTSVQASAFMDTMRAAIARADTTVRTDGRYRAARHMRPYYWLPVLGERAHEDYLGISSGGADLVDRHVWSAKIAVAPASGRTRGAAAYTYRGLPTLPGVGLHPTLSFAVDRNWERLLTNDDEGYHADEREDRAVAALGLEYTRVRMRTGGSVAGEVVRRSRYLYDLPTAQLVKPHDALVGVHMKTYLNTFSMPALAISRENGVAFDVSVRQRWDRARVATVVDDELRTRDGGYREITTWDAAYVALPFGGFSRHVVALRASALFRDGPGAGISGIGGVSGDDSDGDSEESDDDTVSRLLPVRGFVAGTRGGTRAWTASAEYRFPIALVTRGLSPLPVFVDRLSGAAFMDAGHAWCSSDDALRLVSLCKSTSSTAAPLLSVGGEMQALLSFWGFGLPLRVGAGVPIQGGATSRARMYLTAGMSF